jgi:hypothetical protein
MAEHFGHERLKVYQKGMSFASISMKNPPANPEAPVFRIDPPGAYRSASKPVAIRPAPISSETAPPVSRRAWERAAAWQALRTYHG